MVPLNLLRPKSGEGLRPATLVALGLLVVFFFQPALAFFLKVFQSETTSQSLTQNFFQLVLRNLAWGLFMAFGSASLSLVLALPSAVYLAFSKIAQRRNFERVFVLFAVLIFSLPSAALGLLLVTVIPESIPSWLQRGMIPVVLAHVLWNHLLLVAILSQKIRNWVAADGQNQLDSARSLGAGPSAMLRRILIPVLAPELKFFFSLIFLWSLTAFGTVVILSGGPGAGNLETLIFYHLFGAYDESRLVFLLPLSAAVNLVAFAMLKRRLQRATVAPLSHFKFHASAANPFSNFGFFAALSVFVLGFFSLVILQSAWSSLVELNKLDRATGGAFLLSVAIGLCAALGSYGLSFLSSMANRQLHRISIWAIGFSPSLLSLIWAQGLQQYLNNSPLLLQVLSLGGLIALSTWPLLDFWISERIKQIPIESLESAASLGAGLHVRLRRIRWPAVSKLAISAALFSFLCGFADLVFSPVLLAQRKTLALLAQEQAARYEFFETRLFLITSIGLIACFLAGSQLRLLTRSSR